ncbi:hypothetical protein AGMMS49949_04220 [Alphaproteobacteria bacterium]|nr:hypothetical protein AGMMS49949_04220 [Alphaproteobacteria bacterium]GHS97118.1 hypothetical protein AGMMS50296_3830 [Alphaproteobacteria bacterium]
MKVVGGDPCVIFGKLNAALRDVDLTKNKERYKKRDRTYPKGAILKVLRVLGRDF